MPGPSNKTDLNRMNRAASNVQLGSVVAELIALANEQNAVIKAMAAKLNADAGVTDANYTAASLADLKKLEDR